MYDYLKMFIWGAIYWKKNENYEIEIIENIIVNNIKNKGCITIKFIQWFLPKIEAMNDISNKYNGLIKKLEDLYEKCNYHDEKHTLDVFKKDFGIGFHEKYEIIDIIASGSIGQVYKIKDKKRLAGISMAYCG